MSLTYLMLAGGGWVSADESGRIVAVSVPGLGEGSFELLRDAIVEADADLERRRKDHAEREPEPEPRAA